MLPDKPTNLNVTDITSTSAKIAWLDPIIQGLYGISNFRIRLKKGSSLILNIITAKVNSYKISNLSPETTYEISVAAGSYRNYGEEIVSMFQTSKSNEGKCLQIQYIT